MSRVVWIAALAGLLVAGCSSTRRITVTSEPEGVMIQLNGDNAGVTPVSISVDADRGAAVVSASKTGYISEQVTLRPDSRAWEDGHLRVALMEDEAWKVTTTSDATNNWLRVQVDETLTADETWQRLVDSVTTRYTSLEQMDDKSGYLRTVYERRKFSGPQGTYEVRTRLVGSMAQREPLVYKFQIQAERTNSSGDWVPYDRVFKADAALIEELTNRLGIK